MIPKLGVYRKSEHASIPKKATGFASCFDLRACLMEIDSLIGYDRYNRKIEIEVRSGLALIPDGARVLIPTGLIFDIPEGYSMRFHSRSGLSLKNALVLGNHEGVIDADYVDPSMIILYNGADVSQYVSHDDRLCQAEVVKDLEHEIEEIFVAPSQKTDRIGGFGSSGRN
jgi:deoxyuridine 5'-triphosphate nucleotidohydrolase